MIIRKKEHWFRMLFILRGSVLPKLFPRLLFYCLFSVLVVYLRGDLFSYKVQLNPAPFTLFGVALAIFLGFRNTASYDRFWEARKLWGALLNDTRSLARQAIAMTPPKEADILIRYLIAFTHSLRHQLRGTDANVDLQRLLPAEMAEGLRSAVFKPMMILKAMGEWTQLMRLKGHIDTMQQTVFETNFNKLSDITGGCERIANTPIPFTFVVLLHRTIYIYCFLLPFGFVDSLGWVTPVIVTFITYTFTALEALADELEEPFGMAQNDLALDAMSRTIELTLREMNGEMIVVEAPKGDYLT